ncbi:hypothetical protein K440DRAFT_636206 [Wilcoxina mikolae CBS 423.85]|nr:hypothetical protein K440DRAFT_636206 [Wilcoxina mikolae CBS 423.85]
MTVTHLGPKMPDTIYCPTKSIEEQLAALYISEPVIPVIPQHHNCEIDDVSGELFTLLELVSAGCLDPDTRSAGLGHVSDTTVWKALHERGIKAYHEEFQSILSSENKAVRVLWCQERKDYRVDIEWANYGFTDEMAIEVEGTHGMCLVWWEITERWEDDCIGAIKKQGPMVMCWEIIGWNYKDPFYVCDPETHEKRQKAAAEIATFNCQHEEEINLLNTEWRNSEEWKQLKIRELAHCQVVHTEAK